jgi:hypothetical protein
MRLSEKTRTRLILLNLAMWFLSGIAILALMGGPRGVIETYLEPVENELGGWFELALGAAGWNDAPLPRYELKIEPRVFRAAQLLGRDGGSGSREPSDRWWFPARFYADGAVYRVDLQLEDMATSPPRLLEKSWRVRFRGKKSYRGMRELELAPAHERQHAVEVMVREGARDAGLLAPPGGFAILRINGAEARTVFWSERNSKAMLERLGYPAGEILVPRPGAASIPALLVGAGAGSVGLARHMPSIDRDGRSNVAAEKLERLLALTRNASDADFERQVAELLDVEKFLRWNALVWIFGDPDSDGFPGLSWYFDPVTGLIEPIVRDVGLPNAAIANAELAAPNASRLTDRILRNPTYRGRRNEILWELVNRQRGDVVADSDERLGSVLTRLAKSQGSLAHPGALRDYADFRRATRTALREKIASLGTVLAASQVETKPVLTLDAGTPTLTLELKPAGLAEILLSEFRFELGSAVLANREAAAVRLLTPNGEQRRVERVEPVVIGSSVALRPERLAFATGSDGSSGDDASWKVEVRLPFFTPEAWSWPKGLESIDVVYRNALTGEALPPARLLSAETLAAELGGGFRALFRPVEEVIGESGLPFELRGEEMVLPAGDYLLSRTVVVPRSVRLKLDPGVTLRLGPDVSIISFRGIEARGTVDRPIHIRAADPTHPWGSIAVARAPEISNLSFLTVSGGSRSSFEGIEFDGQLSFNASGLTLDDSEVFDAHRSNGLSLKRAAFAVNRTQFVTNGSDGVESEWSQGVIRESLFVNNGDDGLDLADSEVSVHDCAFHWMGDKSISAGERSRVSVNSTRLSDSEIAIASKEDSRVDVRDTEFRRNRLGFSLYRAKPVFGGGSGTVTGGVFARNDKDFSVEPGSNLELIRVQRETAPPREALIGSVALRPVVTRSR